MLRATVALLALTLLASGAEAQKRVALVIGNSDYGKVGKLPNPTRDAGAVEGLLRAAGFEVVEVKRDLGVIAMRRALRDFSDQVRSADIAVVFFAGHGIEVNGTNYLIPVDAALERDIDVEDETVPLDRITQVLEQAKRLRLVILDACRDNPFVRSMRRTVVGRSIGRGLAKVEVLTSDTLIAFAAKAGSTALDGDSSNSPYTVALVKHLTTPGLDLRLALGRVRDEVLKSTNNKQEPFVYGSLGGSEIALVAAAKTAPPAATIAPSPPSLPQLSEAERAWALAKDSTNVAALEAFVARFRDTYYADLAQLRIGELTKQQTLALSAAVQNRVVVDLGALARALQTELKRVGCDPGPIGAAWSGKAGQALGEFMRLTKTALPNEEPSEAALSAVIGQKARVCPLRCSAGETEVGGRCIAKAAPTPPRAKAAPRVQANDTAKGAPQGTGTCWPGGGANKSGALVPCNDPASSGIKAF